MTPSTFVIDTNVVVAGLITRPDHSPATALLDAMLTGSVIYLLSPALLEEYRAVLLRPKIASLHGLQEAEVDQVLIELTANAMWRDPQEKARAPDPADDHLWALLATDTNSILVTGDQLLLDNPPPDHSVISPRGWLDNLNSRSS